MTAPTIADTRHHLTEIPELCALLPDAAETRTAIEGPRPAPGSKPPLRLDVLHLLDGRDKHRDANMATCDPDRQGVLPYLFGWCRDVEADALDQSPELPPELPVQATVAGCCAWLTSMLSFAATLPQWPELADGVRRTHQAVRDATAGVRDVEEKPVPCGRCGGALARIPGTRPMWECAACGGLVTVQAVTVNQAAKIIGIQKDRLYALVNRPALVREAGVTPPQRVLGESGSRKLYDLSDLRRIVAEIRVREGA